MQTLAQLETNAARQPNSIELKQALAERYAAQGRWEEAARAYQALSALHTSTAALFINRIRLGAAALVISSALILLAALIQPELSIGNRASIRSLSAFAVGIRSPAYMAAQILLMISLALYSCSAISIYKLLSYTRDHRPAFWAMVLSVIGVGLSMPALGIKTFVLPQIGTMFLNGEYDVLAVYFAMNEYPRNILLGMGGYLVVFGVSIFSWVVWRNRELSLPFLLLFLAGWIGFVLSNSSLPRQGFIMTGVLIAFGGVGLGLSLWKQASTQFDSGMDRSAS